ncbi:hypothetical protein EDD36DRAFT_296346 [Exophiala viscosa]|uniref:Zn(2)-C6 fungal-type domain-containing protein n=1 Tax=Exophiala viscosa TaxID=2486360 RepID=A0AAN6DT23_9EURO|nr:hypothetical protein EDD36DRAFT_296346 [Exophiala viscosa]
MPDSHRPRRLGYKKSKTGCDSCRNRRVKCDEKQPKCSACHRFGLGCQYSREFRHFVVAQSGEGTSTSLGDERSVVPVVASPLILTPNNIGVTRPQSDGPSFLFEKHFEMRLLHHFVSHTYKSMPGSETPVISECWTSHIPTIAFGHDTLLYAILAAASAHLSLLSPAQTMYHVAAKYYFAIVLQEQNKAVSNITSANADSICLTSLLVNILALHFQNVSDSHPRNTLSAAAFRGMAIGHSSADVIKTAWPSINHDPTSEAAKILKATPTFREVHSGAAEYHSAHGFVVNPPGQVIYPLDQSFTCALREIEEQPPELERDNETTTKAIRAGIGYVQSMRKAIENDEPNTTFCQRVIGFTGTIPKLFLQLVLTNHPRALLTLAYFFALVHHAKSIWWLNGLAERSVRVILETLPKEWKPLMQRPFAMILARTHTKQQ